MDIVMVHNKHSKSNGTTPNGSVSSKKKKGKDQDTMSVDGDDLSEENMMKAISEEILRHPPWESHDRAEVCPDCDAEQLSRRREYEKAEIRRLEDDGFVLSLSVLCCFTG